MNVKEVLEAYQIKEFPALILLKRNKLKDNDFFKFEFTQKFSTANLTKFLNKYAFPKKIKYHSSPSSQDVKGYLFKFEEFEEEYTIISEKNFNLSQELAQFKHEKISFVHITKTKTPFHLYSQIIERMRYLRNTTN